MFNNIINVYCDERNAYITFENKFKCFRKRDNDNQPFIEFICNNYIFKVYADFTNTNLPKKVVELLTKGCRPDYIFYNENDDKIIFLIEDTVTAPVGNAQKQRLPRIIIPFIEKIPLLYVTPNDGFDASQNIYRKLTGILKELKIQNPNSIISPSDFNIEFIINDIINSNIDKYIIKKMVNLSIFNKTKVSIKRTEYEFVIELISLINNDNNIVNVFEEDGNIYLIPSNSNVAKYLKISEDFILIIGRAWKPDGNTSDPFTGGLFSLGLLNKSTSNQKKIVIVSPHNCNLCKTDKLINKKNNKLTQALELCDILFDGNGEMFDLKQIKYLSDENFEYNGDGESIVLYCRHIEILKNNEKNVWVQYPHGSWGSKDGLNNNKRDDKRPDIICESHPNGIEVKLKLSDIYKHVKKYGIIHDEYTYGIHDCIIDNSYEINLRKVNTNEIFR